MRKVLNILHLSFLELSAIVRYICDKLIIQWRFLFCVFTCLSPPLSLSHTHSYSLCCCFTWFQASIRRSSAYLIGYFFKNSKLYLVDEAPNMISTLIVLLSDSDSDTVAVCAIRISSSVVILFTERYMLDLLNRFLGKHCQEL